MQQLHNMTELKLPEDVLYSLIACCYELEGEVKGSRQCSQIKMMVSTAMQYKSSDLNTM